MSVCQYLNSHASEMTDTVEEVQKAVSVTPSQLNLNCMECSWSAHTLVFWVGVAFCGSVRTWHSRSSTKPATITSCEWIKLHMIYILNSLLWSPSYPFSLLPSLSPASKIEFGYDIACFSKLTMRINRCY